MGPLSAILVTSPSLTSVLRMTAGVSAASADDTDQIRSQFDDVLARREFDYDPSLGQRFMSWLGRMIERLLESLRIPGAGAAGGPGIGSYLVTLLLIGAVVAIVVVAVRRIRRNVSRRGPDDDGPAMSMVVRTNDSGDGWMDDYLRDGDPAEAKLQILEKYRRIVDALTDREVLSGAAGDSPRELASEYGESFPSTGPLMAEATDIFEAPWYGDAPGTHGDAVRLDDLTTRILDGDERRVGSE